jgi:hypothetical protein
MMNGRMTVEEMYAEAAASIERQGAELQARDHAEQAERDRANAEARDRHLASVAARDEQRREANDRDDLNRRTAAEATHRAAARASFLAINANATDEDFERVYPAMRDEHLRRAMSEAEAMRQADYAAYL